jgi:hypothetical protein
MMLYELKHLLSMGYFLGNEDQSKTLNR